MLRMCRAVSPIAAASLSAAALGADPVFLASQGQSFYRATEGFVENYATDVEMLSMFYDEQLNSVLVGTRGVSGNAPLYMLQNPTAGDPVFQPYAILDRFYGSLTRIGDVYFGFHEGDLYSIDLEDPADPIEAFIGATGLTTSGGCAYDVATDTLFMFARETDRLYRVDQSTAALSVIGTVADDFGGTGLEWWDGQLYVSVQNFSSGEFEIGTLSTADASYQLVMPLGVPAMPQSTSLAIVPEPAMTWLPIALGIVALRRARR